MSLIVLLGGAPGPKLASFVLSGSGALTFPRTAIHAGGFALAGTGALTATTVRVRTAAFADAGAGALAFAPRVIRGAAFGLPGAGTLTFTPTKVGTTTSAGAPWTDPRLAPFFKRRRPRWQEDPEPAVLLLTAAPVPAVHLWNPEEVTFLLTLFLN